MIPPYAPWPAEDLESVDACPVCGSRTRSLLYAGLTDRVFGVAPGRWNLYLCGGCASGYLDPRPSARSIGLAYANYYTHASQDVAEDETKGFLVRLLHAWVNDYFNARYKLNRRPASFGGRWLVPLSPSSLAKARAKMRHLAECSTQCTELNGQPL